VARRVVVTASSVEPWVLEVGGADLVAQDAAAADRVEQGTGVSWAVAARRTDG